MEIEKCKNTAEIVFLTTTAVFLPENLILGVLQNGIVHICYLNRHRIGWYYQNIKMLIALTQ